MATVKLILTQKGSHVYSVGVEATVLNAALLMNDHQVGALVVLKGSRVKGIFTERDVLRRVVAKGRDPAATRIGEVMTSDVICCRTETSIDEARGVFKNQRIRHLPVVNDQKQLLGLISIGDLNAYHATAQEQTINSLEESLYGLA
ncbi:MAG: CBS domain-containing protein [Vicinamibacterales bacterium]|jgi:CBS domain-containing protein|nr:CBS domain-containing protein [Vicinamibacterales bacterium]